MISAQQKVTMQAAEDSPHDRLPDPVIKQGLKQNLFIQAQSTL
jgi:hypothetical protein